jgi:hypothetical protein
LPSKLSTATVRQRAVFRRSAPGEEEGTVLLKAIRPALPLALGLALSGASAAYAIDEFFPEFGNNSVH